jgi:hypothetical protein
MTARMLFDPCGCAYKIQLIERAKRITPLKEIAFGCIFDALRRIYSQRKRACGAAAGKRFRSDNGCLT